MFEQQILDGALGRNPTENFTQGSIYAGRVKPFRWPQQRCWIKKSLLNFAGSDFLFIPERLLGESE
jgi:hypothetical protein